MNTFTATHSSLYDCTPMPPTWTITFPLPCKKFPRAVWRWGALQNKNARQPTKATGH